MNKSMLVILGIAAVVVIIGVGYMFLSSNNAVAPTALPINTPTTDRIQADTGSDSVDMSDDMNQEATKTVTVTANEYKFSPATITVKKGEKVKLVLNNTGKLQHDWVVEGEGIATKIAPAGSSSEVEFTMNETGEFPTFCSVGNHKAMGMVGKIVVE